MNTYVWLLAAVIGTWLALRSNDKKKKDKK